MNTQAYLLARFGVRRLPKSDCIEVPNVGRDDLAVIFAELGFTEGAEIGVKEADYSAVLLKANPRLHLRSIDPWLVRADYRDGRGQGQFTTFRDTAVRVLAQYPGSEVIQDFSLDVAKRTPDRSLDFVYIDGHHSFQATTNDIVEWSKKVKIGGIIAGHDYARYRYGSDIAVKEVVDAYTAAHRIRPWFVLGRKEKRDGEVRDRHRSFLWVNELIKTPGTRLDG
jgi:hypothetical protein